MVRIAAGIAEPDNDPKPARESARGWVAAFIDETRKMGAMVELSCESEPAERSEKFRNLAAEISRCIATNADKSEASADQPQRESVVQADMTLSDITIAELLTDASLQLNEAIAIRRFVRFKAS